MKLKIILSFALIYSALINFSNAQNSWCYPGATWYYSISSFGSFGYLKVSYTGDTTINNILCNKLEKIAYQYAIGNIYDTTRMNTEYVTAANGNVLIYRNGNFYNLYKFDAIQGDTINSPPDQSFIACNDTLARLTVDSTGTVTINNDVLRYYTTQSSEYIQPGRSIERIGNLTFLLPQPFCIADIPFVSDLRCYSDNTGWTFTNFQQSCDYINSIDENNSDNISIFPIPSKDLINIVIKDKSKNKDVFIYSAEGKLMKTIKSDEAFLQIPISEFADGNYFIKVKSNNGIMTKKFVKN